jgi:hypothetical protein
MKASITFNVSNPKRFRAAYRHALKSSGFDGATKRAKVRDMDPEQALAEIMAHHKFDWEHFGLVF